MAENSDSTLSVIYPENQAENKENETFEPEKKKIKLEVSSCDFKLEERLCGILCCAVCLDLPRTCYQVKHMFSYFLCIILISWKRILPLILVQPPFLFENNHDVAVFISGLHIRGIA